MAARAAAALVLCALWATSTQVRAATCAARAACEKSGSLDAVELRDGTVLCGTIVYRDDGNSLLVVDAEHRSRTISWDDITCLDQHAAVVPAPASAPASAPAPAAAPPALPPQAPSAQPESDPIVVDDELSERRVWLEWDVRVAGTTLWKRYVQRDAAAWSWGMAGGLGFGATFHYALGMTGGLGPIQWSDLELGVAGTVTYGAWSQINGAGASMIEQDVSLRVGTRFRLGGPTSSLIAGISWLPTYVDFYGRQIKTPGTINPLGVRLTFDLGSALGSYRQATVFRIALAYLPYVGRLPSMFSLSAGIALD